MVLFTGDIYHHSRGFSIYVGSLNDIMEEIVTRLHWQVGMQAETQWRGNCGAVAPVAFVFILNKEETGGSSLTIAMTSGPLGHELLCNSWCNSQESQSLLHILLLLFTCFLLTSLFLENSLNCPQFHSEYSYFKGIFHIWRFYSSKILLNVISQDLVIKSLSDLDGIVILI